MSIEQLFKAIIRSPQNATTIIQKHIAETQPNPDLGNILLNQYMFHIISTSPIESDASMSTRFNPQVIDALISVGADVNYSKSATPLIDSLSSCFASTVYLISKGAKVNSSILECNPLLHAIRNKLPKHIKLLKEHGADLNTRGDDGRTVLMNCITHKHYYFISLLLENEAQIDPSEDGSCDALTIAAEAKTTDALKILLQYKHLIKNADSALCHAIRLESEALPLLLKELSSTQYSAKPLLYAAQHGAVHAIPHLLKVININSEYQNTTALKVAIQHKQLGCIHEFLKYKACVDYTSLIKSAHLKEIAPIFTTYPEHITKILKYLVAIQGKESFKTTCKGISQQIFNEHAKSIAYSILKQYISSDQSDVAKRLKVNLYTLITHIVDPTIVRDILSFDNIMGQSCLELLIRNDTYIQKAKEYLASVKKKSSDPDVWELSQTSIKQNPKDFKESFKSFLINNKMFINKLAFLAAQNGDIEVIKFLVEKHAYDINSKDTYGNTLFEVVTELDHINILKYILDHPNFSLFAIEIETLEQLFATARHDKTESATHRLLDLLNQSLAKQIYNAVVSGKPNIHDTIENILAQCKLDIDTVDISGASALHIAARENHLHAVQFFINLGANTTLADKQLRTPDQLTSQQDIKNELSEMVVLQCDVPTFSSSTTSQASSRSKSVTPPLPTTPPPKVKAKEKICILSDQFTSHEVNCSNLIKVSMETEHDCYSWLNIDLQINPKFFTALSTLCTRFIGQAGIKFSKRSNIVECKILGSNGSGDERLLGYKHKMFLTQGSGAQATAQEIDVFEFVKITSHARLTHDIETIVTRFHLSDHEVNLSGLDLQEPVV